MKQEIIQYKVAPNAVDKITWYYSVNIVNCSHASMMYCKPENSMAMNINIRQLNASAHYQRHQRHSTFRKAGKLLNISTTNLIQRHASSQTQMMAKSFMPISCHARRKRSRVNTICLAFH